MKQTTQKRISKAELKVLRGTSEQERILHRLHSVILVLRGFSCSAVGRLYGDSARSVAYWVKRYDALGAAGLKEQARSGRPSKLTPSQLRSIESFMSNGSASSPVTGEALSAFIRKMFDVSLTVRQCRRIVRRFSS